MDMCHRYFFCHLLYIYRTTSWNFNRCCVRIPYMRGNTLNTFLRRGILSQKKLIWHTTEFNRFEKYNFKNTKCAFLMIS